MEPTITSIALSVDLANKEYGNGDNGFLSISAKYPGEGKPIGAIGDVVDQSLVMFGMVWKTLLAQRTAAGLMTFPDLVEKLSKIEKRFQKAQEILKTNE
jgi:hypothetical protein